MTSKLYVGNLPYEIEDEDLQNLFASHGSIVSATVIKDRTTGRSKGFGFVEFETADEAGAAIDALHSTEVNGRAILVKEARPQERNNDRRGRRSFNHSSRD